MISASHNTHTDRPNPDCQNTLNYPTTPLTQYIRTLLRHTKHTYDKKNTTAHTYLQHMHNQRDLIQSLHPPETPHVGPPQNNNLGARLTNTYRASYLYITHRALTGKLRRLAHHILPLHDSRHYVIPNIPPPALLQSLTQLTTVTAKPVPSLPHKLTNIIPKDILPGPILTSRLPFNNKLANRDYMQHIHIHPPTPELALHTYSFTPDYTDKPYPPPPNTYTHPSHIPQDHLPHWLVYHENVSNTPQQSLGTPYPTQTAQEMVYHQLPPTPIPVLHPTTTPEEELLFRPDLKKHLVYTSKGWRPTAAILRHSVQQFKDTNAPPYILALLKHGHFPTWAAVPEPIYFPNHLTAYLNSEETTMQINILRQTGVLLPYDDICIAQWGPPTVILPLSLKEEGPFKFRLLVDPRYLNIPTMYTKIEYEDPKSFFTLVPPNMNINKTDMTSGFQQLLLHKGMYPYVVIQWQDCLYYFTTCFFGEAQTPKVFQQVTRHVTTVLRTTPQPQHPTSTDTTISPRHPLVHNYSDDFINTTSPDTDHALTIHNHQLTTLVGMGPVFSINKTYKPALQQTIHGLTLHTDTLTMSIPPDKVTKFTHTLDRLAQLTVVLRPEIKLQELLQEVQELPRSLIYRRTPPVMHGAAKHSTNGRTRP